MNEPQAWNYLAQVLAMQPPARGFDNGICNSLYTMYLAETIDYYLRLGMISRLYNRYGHLRFPRNDHYFWDRLDFQSRIEACKVLAQDAQKEIAS